MTSEPAHDDLPFEESERGCPLVLAERYELGETLGLGGSGEVHRAWDRKLQRAVAVKLFAPSVHGPDRRRQGQELQTLARLSHPGLVELHDAGRDGGRAFLVMRLVDGPSLAELVVRGPLPPLTVATLGAQLANALAYVHAAGVTHRDLKPDNVLLDEQGRPLLADFGIALLVDSTRVTVAGGVVGTAAYMAPEQVRGEPVGPAADVYALGLVLLEALRGEREFPGTTHETVLARLHRAPRVPDDLPGDLPALLRAMTASDPAERPGAAAVAVRLRVVVLALEPGTVPVAAVLAGLGGSGSAKPRAVPVPVETDAGPPTAPSALDALFPEARAHSSEGSSVSAVAGSRAAGDGAPQRRRRRLAVAASFVGVLAAASVSAAVLGLGGGSGRAGAAATLEAAAAEPFPTVPVAPLPRAPEPQNGVAPPETVRVTVSANRDLGSGAGALRGSIARPARASAGTDSAPSPTRRAQPTTDAPRTSTPTRSTEDRAPRPSRGDQHPKPTTAPSSGAPDAPRDDGGSSRPSKPSPPDPSDGGGGDGPSRDDRASGGGASSGGDSSGGDSSGGDSSGGDSSGGDSSDGGSSGGDGRSSGGDGGPGREG